MPAKRAAKLPSSIDVAVGRNVRIWRMARGLSQAQLASRMGVTFQQLQKYEVGANRIGTGRLVKLRASCAFPSPRCSRAPTRPTPRARCSRSCRMRARSGSPTPSRPSRTRRCAWRSSAWWKKSRSRSRSRNAAVAANNSEAGPGRAICVPLRVRKSCVATAPTRPGSRPCWTGSRARALWRCRRRASPHAAQSARPRSRRAR